jgi:two-component system, NarL family, response regulator LiaR
METVRVLIVDDHEIVRQGLFSLLADQPGIEVVGQAGDGEAALAMATEKQPQVVLLDLKMPGLDGIATLRHCRPWRQGCGCWC